MIKLKDLLMEAVNVAKQSTKSLLRLHGQMKDERLSGQSALLFRLITKELVKRKVKLESVNEASSFDSVAKGWVKYFLKRHGKNIFKKVVVIIEIFTLLMVITLTAIMKKLRRSLKIKEFFQSDLIQWWQL